MPRKKQTDRKEDGEPNTKKKTRTQNTSSSSVKIAGEKKWHTHAPLNG
jgi:hypothetical protein